MGEAHRCFCFAAPEARLRPFGKALETNHHRPSYPDFLSMLVTLSNCMRLSLKKAAPGVSTFFRAEGGSGHKIMFDHSIGCRIWLEKTLALYQGMAFSHAAHC